MERNAPNSKKPSSRASAQRKTVEITHSTFMMTRHGYSKPARLRNERRGKLVGKQF